MTKKHIFFLHNGLAFAPQNLDFNDILNKCNFKYVIYLPRYAIGIARHMLKRMRIMSLCHSVKKEIRISNIACHANCDQA